MEYLLAEKRRRLRFLCEMGQDTPIPEHPVPDDEGNELIMMGIAD